MEKQQNVFAQYILIWTKNQGGNLYDKNNNSHSTSWRNRYIGQDGVIYILKNGNRQFFVWHPVDDDFKPITSLGIISSRDDYYIKKNNLFVILIIPHDILASIKGNVPYTQNQITKGYFLSLAMISSATFLPDINMPPKIGPIRGVPETAEAAIPQTYRPG